MNEKTIHCIKWVQINAEIEKTIAIRSQKRIANPFNTGIQEKNNEKD